LPLKNQFYILGGKSVHLNKLFLVNGAVCGVNIIFFTPRRIESVQGSVSKTVHRSAADKSHFQPLLSAPRYQLCRSAQTFIKTAPALHF
jgi:hypothetical protein